jgi:DNA-binding MarR family transcriptional regulator
MSPSGLTRVVDKLVASGHVRRARSEGDARVMLVQLTDQGRELLRRAARTHLRGIREHFTGRLDQARLGEVADALEAVAGPHQPH